MAFAGWRLYLPTANARMKDVECVAVSYPGFFNDLERIVER